MSIEKLSPNMRNCIASLQAERIVSVEFKIENKNNNGSLLSKLLKVFR